MKKECKLCKSKDIKSTGLNLNKYNLYKCNNCDLQFIFPIPSQKEIKKYYEDYLTKKENKYEDKNLNNIRLNTLWKKRLEITKKYVNNIKNKTVLDIGSGTGEWLGLLSKNQIKKIKGIEISKEEYNNTKQKYDIENISLSDYKSKTKIDLISMWDIIEHLDDIDKSFLNVHNMLNENGILVLSTINTDSISFKLRKNKWRYFYPPEHIFYFNKKSIYYLAKKYNFKIKYYKTQPLLQGYLLNNNEINNEKNINISKYRLKLHLERILSIFIKNKGEILTVVLEK